jgi:heme A synthase
LRCCMHKAHLPAGRFSGRRVASTVATSSAAAPRTAAAPAAAALKPRPLSSRPVATWLFGTAGAVAVMVTVGGVTRLTKSGLAMTDWKLQGSLPPMNQQEWEAEFSRYKQFPEYQQRKSMTLDEFKFIFWWEYGHRMLGRTLGVIYGVPLLYFTARRMIPAHITGKVALLLGLGGTQGLVGWWMVRSGLNLSPQQQKEIRVSPYRLATHLGMAFTTFALLVHTGLEALHGPAAAQQVSLVFLYFYQTSKVYADVNACIARMQLLASLKQIGSQLKLCLTI